MLTFCVSFVIVGLAIVLWKPAKPTGGGEPAGISLFFITGEYQNGYFKTLFNLC